MFENYLITQEGYKKLIKELKNLKEKERLVIIKEISEARSHGDLSENSEYQAAREKQSFLERKISKLEYIYSKVKVISSKKLFVKKVVFGSKVKLINKNNKTFLYRIVSDYESNVNKGLLSISSPFVQKMINLEEKESFVFINKNNEKQTFRIISIKYI